MHKKGIYERLIKRPMDFVLSLIAIIVLSPVLLITALLVRIKLGSPILFRQERPGKNEEIFTMYKFRTMTNKKDGKGNLLPDKDRLTKFGNFIRSTSLDELPGLFNIFRGDMSIIGPRPLLVKYLPYYNEVERKRHLVRPGLTGLSQVNGRSLLNWDKRFELDVKYVNDITFLTDLMILFKTIFKVIKRSDIAVGANKTMRSLDVERYDKTSRS